MSRITETLLRLYAWVTTPPARSDDPERGSVTIEHVLWGVAVIAIVGIVVLAITNYVTSQAGKIS